MSDLELMQSIKTKYATPISFWCGASSVPPGLLAALVANESGGNANAKRLEHTVLAQLWEVLLGRKAAYGSIGRVDLVNFVARYEPNGRSSLSDSLPADAFQRVDGLATSWGLTQIMGYQCLDHSAPFQKPEELQQPLISLKATVWLLNQFAKGWHLDVAADFEELLRCWNTGRPDGQTFDPAYVPNGLARKVAYEALP